MITLDDDEARGLGAVIGGAYDRPKIVEDLEMALGELQIEWVPVPDTARASARPSPSAASEQRRDHRDRHPPRARADLGAQPTDVLERGDTLVTVGKAGQYAAFRRMLSGASQ